MYKCVAVVCVISKALRVGSESPKASQKPPRQYRKPEDPPQ